MTNYKIVNKLLKIIRWFYKIIVIPNVCMAIGCLVCEDEHGFSVISIFFSYSSCLLFGINR